MASLSLSSPTTSGCSWSVSGLSSDWNTTNYIKIVISTGTTTSGSSTPPSGIKSTKTAPSSGTSRSVSGSVSGLSSNTTYTFYAYAQVPSGKYYSAGSSSITTDKPTLSIPSLSKISSTSSSIQVTASSISGAEEYYIECKNGGESYYHQGGRTKTFSGLNSNTTYTFKTRALDTDESHYDSSLSSSYNYSTDSIPDTTNPTCSITSPANGIWTKDNSITINATASDNVAVDYVNFYLAELGTIQDSSSPYSANFDISGLSNGSYTFSVRAYDTSGNFSTQQYVTINIDRTAPSRNIDSTSSTSSSITVNASGLDSGSGMNGFIFYLGGVSQTTIYSSTTASYTYNSLSAETNYTVGVATFDNVLNYSTILSTNVTTLALNPRPSNFSWTTTKTSLQDFDLTATEWNGLQDRINGFRLYKGLSEYTINSYGAYTGTTAFTRGSTGQDFMYYQFNQAVNSINDMTPPILPPTTKSSGNSVYASYLNDLVTSLNSIT